MNFMILRRKKEGAPQITKSLGLDSRMEKLRSYLALSRIKVQQSIYESSKIDKYQIRSSASFVGCAEFLAIQTGVRINISSEW
jgi:hypothetical protein